MPLLLLLSGCLINQALYDQRYAELTEAGGDSAAPDDTTCTPLSVWVDADGDGWGNPDYPDTRCGDLSGWATEGGDCDDVDPAVNPAAAEVCGTVIDEDCDGVVSECRMEGEFTAGDADVTLFGAVRDDLARPFVVGDLSGDGLDDVAIADATGLHLLQDPGDGEWDIAEVEFLSVETDERAPLYFRAVGADFDGDGTRDFATTTTDDQFSISAVLVFQGGQAGDISADDAWIRWDGAASRTRGFSLTAVDDISGDGLPEILIGDLTNDGLGTSGAILLQPGTSESLDESMFSVSFPAQEAIGYATASGDMNGDRIPDLILTAPSDVVPGCTYVFHGPLPGVPMTAADADTTITGSVGDLLGLSVVFEPVLDADGDGNLDLLVGAMGVSTAYLFEGPFPSSLTLEAAAGTFVGNEASQQGANLSHGDLDGDGRDDVLLSPYRTSGGGGAFVYYGPLAGSYDTAASDVAVLIDHESGYTATSAGDLDGDGADELLLVHPSVTTSSLFRGLRP